MSYIQQLDSFYNRLCQTKHNDADKLGLYESGKLLADTQDRIRKEVEDIKDSVRRSELGVHHDNDHDNDYQY